MPPYKSFVSSCAGGIGAVVLLPEGRRPLYAANAATELELTPLPLYPTTDELGVSNEFCRFVGGRPNPAGS